MTDALVHLFVIGAVSALGLVVGVLVFFGLVSDS